MARDHHAMELFVILVALVSSVVVPMLLVFVVPALVVAGLTRVTD